MTTDNENGIFQMWVKEAKDEVQTKGWKDASMNALLLLCHDMSDARDRRLLKMVKGPVRVFVGICASGLLWYIISDTLNL